MNKYCALAAALVSLCLLSCKKAEEPVTEQEQDYVNIPDAKFKSYLLEKYDEDKDGNISLNEAEKVKDIDCRSLDITDLTGIRCFSELVSLNCSNNGITNLTLSGPATKGDIAEGDCSNLKNLDCSSNKISSPASARAGLYHRNF